VRGVLLVYATIAAVLVMLLPREALAWGPAMHMEIGLCALAQAAAIAPAIAALIRKFPKSFLYGATSPDIIFGKKYYGYMHHCHNWRMGELILSEAETDRQRAAAYGYLMHLAADAVAHNYYIPVKIVRSWRARLFSHTYWEMRFDLGVSERAWDRLGKASRIDIEEFDALLKRVLSKTLFSFRTNKRIFNTIVMLQKLRGLRTSLKLYAEYSRFDICEENRQHYVDLAMEAALEFLSHPKTAACLQLDPTGQRRLDDAAALRSEIRAQVRRGEMSEAQAERLVEFTREQLAMGLYRPSVLVPRADDVF
jgi:hypothetical protein